MQTDQYFDAEISKLMKSYSTNNCKDLIRAQAYHIEKLQFKLEGKKNEEFTCNPSFVRG